MKKYFQIALIIFPIIGLAKKTFGQASTVHPFVGISINFLGVSGPGFGAEVGLSLENFYIGAEYGIYDIGTVGDVIFQKYYATNPYGVEQYFSINGGVVINKTFWFGLTILISIQPYLHFDNTGNYYQVDKTRFDAGPDFRIQFWKHWLFDLAYSYRRGLKTGLGFIL